MATPTSFTAKAASIGFEVMESLVAEIISPGTGPAWLGAQGDEWDMQFDLAGGALVAAIGRRYFYERSRSFVTPSFPAQQNMTPFFSSPWPMIRTRQ
jgi:uncharacterized membrane protein YjdF